MIIRTVVAAASLLCLAASPSYGRERCASEDVRPISDAARAALKRAAPPMLGAKAAVGKFYDVSQCVSVKGGKKLRDWGRDKRREYEAGK